MERHQSRVSARWRWVCYGGGGGRGQLDKLPQPRRQCQVNTTSVHAFHIRQATHLDAVYLS